MPKECPHCGKNKFHKNGSSKGIQRYKCNSCLRYFSDAPPKYSRKFKLLAIKALLRNGGFRAVAEVFGVSHSTLIYWFRKFHEECQDELERAKIEYQNDETPDTIEIDEVYTYVKKKAKEESYGQLILDGQIVLLLM